MQTSLLSRCEGRCVQSLVCLDQRQSTAIKPVDKLSIKRMSKNSRTLYLNSAFKPSLGIEKYYGETSKRSWPVNNSSNPDKRGEVITDERKSGGSFNLLTLVGSVICYMFKGLMNILSFEKKYLVKLEDKIENATDVVEEVADTVQQVANFTEDIAKKVEQHSNDGAVIHEAAEFVDSLSEKVSKEAQIVDMAAEEIEKSVKSVGTDMEEVEDASDDIEDTHSKAIVNGDENPTGKQNLQDPEVVAKKE